MVSAPLTERRLETSLPGKLRIFYSRHHPNGDADSAFREQLPQWPSDCEPAISQRRAKLFGTYQFGVVGYFHLGRSFRHLFGFQQSD